MLIALVTMMEKIRNKINRVLFQNLGDTTFRDSSSSSEERSLVEDDSYFASKYSDERAMNNYFSP